jgi:hypothetical protein
MLKKSETLRRETIRPRPQPPRAPRERPPAGAGAQPRNRSNAAGRKASFALEASATKPSRKSSRRSANRAKPDSQLIRRETRRSTSPGERALRGK